MRLLETFMDMDRLSVRDLKAMRRSILERIAIGDFDCTDGKVLLKTLKLRIDEIDNTILKKRQKYFEDLHTKGF